MIHKNTHFGHDSCVTVICVSAHNIEEVYVTSVYCDLVYYTNSFTLLNLGLHYDLALLFTKVVLLILNSA